MKLFKHRKTNTALSHPYVIPKRVDLVEIESRILVTRYWGGVSGGEGGCW